MMVTAAQRRWLIVLLIVAGLYWARGLVVGSVLYSTHPVMKIGSWPIYPS